MGKSDLGSITLKSNELFTIALEFVQLDYNMAFEPLKVINNKQLHFTATIFFYFQDI